MHSEHRPPQTRPERPTAAPPTKPAGIQAMSPKLWARVQTAIRKLAGAQ